MLPLLLNLTNKHVVVIGGGAVGRRKAVTLLDAGALVRLVCLEARPSEEPHPQLDWLTASYNAAHLDGAVLVVAAGPPEVNQRVVVDAVGKGIWVNSATQPEQGNFILPALVRRGEFVVAVSTGGAAPYLARRVRDRLAEQFDEVFGDWVALLAELRPLIIERVPEVARRQELLERLTHWEWLERLRHEGVEAVRRALRADAGLDDV